MFGLRFASRLLVVSPAIVGLVPLSCPAWRDGGSQVLRGDALISWRRLFGGRCYEGSVSGVLGLQEAILELHTLGFLLLLLRLVGHKLCFCSIELFLVLLEERHSDYSIRRLVCAGNGRCSSK